MEFKLSDFCPVVLCRTPEYIKNLGEVLVLCDFMPRKKDCRSGYHKCVVPMVHYKREREREKE